jgi:hypothetical protein
MIAMPSLKALSSKRLNTQHTHQSRSNLLHCFFVLIVNVDNCDVIISCTFISGCALSVVAPWEKKTEASMERGDFFDRVPCTTEINADHGNCM